MKCNTTIRFLRDIADIQTGPFGSQLHKEDYVEYGTPIVTVEHLGNRKFTEQNLPKVSDSDKERLKKYVLATGDIVFSRVGSVDRCSYVDEEHNGWMFSGRCLRVRPSENIDSLYLYYYFCREETRQFVRNIAVGATMPSINTKLLGEVPVAVPDLQIQKMVSNILSTIDNKIELNNKINANLQQQAQAIFKSWFVDFEPFQDGEFVESELGPIPKGWRVGTLSELVAVKYGKDHKKLTDGPYPVYGSGGIMRYVERPIYTKESVLIPRKGTLNNVIYLNEPFWSVDTMFYTEMKMENVAKYVYHFVSGKDLASMNSGSAVPSMTTDILNSMKVVIPTAEWLAKFEQILLPLYSQMFQNAAQSKTLAQLRDTLLPKLMNGGIEATP